MKLLTSLTLAASLAVSGSAIAAEKLKMATIAPGTSAYLTMTTFANLVNSNQDEYEFKVDSTGAATKHGLEVSKGKLDYAMSGPMVYFLLKNGKAMYSKVKNPAEMAEAQRLVLWFPYGQYHFITYADSGINSLKDIKGKKVFLGPPGGGAWNAAYTWVKNATGLDAKAGDYESVKASWSSAFQGFQDRQFDVYVNGGIAPFPQVEQLALTNDIRLLGLTKDAFDANPEAAGFAKKPGREIGVISKSAYAKGVEMEGDLYTAGATVGIITATKQSDDEVYAVTKAFWDNIEAARATSPWLSDITMEYAVHNGGMKLHPGAQRYYEERGVAIPDGSRN